MTQDDSILFAEKNRQINDQRVSSIINTLREESKQFLLPNNANENFEFGDENVSLSKIWQKLSRNNQFRKKRELKAALKL